MGARARRGPRFAFADRDRLSRRLRAGGAGTPLRAVLHAVARTRRARRGRRGMTIGLLVLASITIITLDYRGHAHGVISGAKRGAHDAFSPVATRCRRRRSPRRQLPGRRRPRRRPPAAERQAATRARSPAAPDAVNQSTRNSLRALQRLDQLPWVGSTPTVTAQVIALSPSDFAATVELDVGSTSGVAVGMPVVGGAGLVGQVIEVWSSGCTVRLVTDVRSAVGVRYGPQGDLALAQGSGRAGTSP